MLLRCQVIKPGSASQSSWLIVNFVFLESSFSPIIEIKSDLSIGCLMIQGIKGIFLFLFLIVIIPGCSQVAVRDGMGDTDAFDMSLALIEEGEYRDAIKVLKEFINRYPSSPLLENAYFEIGRAYYLDKQNIEAEVALDDFMRLYPGSDQIPGALFLKGNTIERGLEKPGRDQSNTVNAIEIYTQIVEKYPETREGKDAQKRIKKLRENLAKHEFAIARFYFKTKLYFSAETRLKIAFQKYSSTETAPQIVNLLARTYLKEEKIEEARKLSEFMVKYYPDRKDTKTLLKELDEAER